MTPATPKRRHLCGTTCNTDASLRAARLAAKAVRQGDCLMWTGTVLQNGYGTMRVHYRREYVHRISYELAKGPIPDGLHIDHLCRNRRCVEPSHLEAVTPAENTRRAVPHWEPRTKPKPERCGKGHPITDENTYRRTPRGWGCRECDRQWGRTHYVPRERQPETHCRKAGHEFTPENTIIQASGARTCRACRLASKRRASAARRSQ